MECDLIMVMDDGRVAEMGPPSELLRKADGHFTALVDACGPEAAAHLRGMVMAGEGEEEEDARMRIVPTPHSRLVPGDASASGSSARGNGAIEARVIHV